MPQSNLFRFVLVALGILAMASPARAEGGDVVGEIDLLEFHLGRGSNHFVLDSTIAADAGQDQFVLKLAGGSETRTAFDDVEVQALYSHRLSESVTVMGGVRRDFREGSDLTHGSVAFEAKLTDWLEAEHYLFLSQRGNLTGSGQVLASWNLTPRLVFEPRVSAGWSAQEVPGEALAVGLTDLDASIRLRRAVGQKLNVYVGVIHERLLGGTRNIARGTGEPTNVTRAVVGLGLTL